MSQGQSLGHGLNRQDGREMTPLDDLLNAVFSEDQLLRAVIDTVGRSRTELEA